MDFIDLKTQQQLIRADLEARWQRVLAHGQYIMGPEIQELEERLAAYVGVKEVVACSSGTDALLLALMALEVGPGEAVFTTPFTFVATAEVIALLGARPIFVDIEESTFNLDPEALARQIKMVQQEGKWRPRGIIAVDLFGQPAAYDRITAVAEAYGLFVVEDAAQSFGATYKGRRAGSLAPLAATSFFPAKPLGCYGDGGAVFTSDPELADRLRSLRNHGQGRQRYEHVRLGLNGRLDTLQAAVLLAKLEIFPQEVERRQEVAARYHDGLRDLVRVPEIAPDCTSVWAQYSIRTPQRQHLQQQLQAAGIPTAIYYPVPLHLQPAFQYLGYRPGDLPVSEACAQDILSLPMHPYLTAEKQDFIIATIRRALG